MSMNPRKRSSAVDSNAVRGEYTSSKWISAIETGSGKRELKVHPEASEALAIANKRECNLISIFGRARQGKSFLMNCLAGEKEIFRISNEHMSCTQGIDISNKWLSVWDFANVHNPHTTASSSKSSQTDIICGFVDAEGQGDRDVNYDANLVCPILLASKAVIFNWKGDLQKDHILSTLGIMTRAAKNVSSESSSKTSKFGHLHIIFRDWQATNSDPQVTYNLLFGEEQNSEAMIRNQIRKDVLAAFTSVQVWLFDAPSESTAVLKTKLTYEKTSQAFKNQVQELRKILASQLSTPTYFAGAVLKGNQLGSLIQQVVESLNRGEVILPSSTYITMMKAELSKCLSFISVEIEKCVHESIEKLDRFHKPGNSETFPRCETLLAGLQDSISHILDNIHNDIQVSFGNIDKDSNLYKSIMASFPKDVQEIVSKHTTLFDFACKESLTRWLSTMREEAIKSIEKEFNSLLQNEEVLNIVVGQFCEQMKLEAMGLLGGSLHQNHEMLASITTSIYREIQTWEEKLLVLQAESRQREDALIDNLLSTAMDKMKQLLDETFVAFTDENLFPNGFPLKAIEQSLNNNFSEIRDEFVKSMADNRPALIATFKANFQKQCANELRPAMVLRFQAAKQSFLDNAMFDEARLLKEACETMIKFEDFTNDEQLSETWLQKLNFHYNQVLIRSSNWDFAEADIDIIANTFQEKVISIYEELMERFESYRMSLSEETELVEAHSSVSPRRKGKRQEQQDKAFQYAVSQGWVDQKGKRLARLEAPKITRILSDVAKTARERAKLWAQQQFDHNEDLLSAADEEELRFMERSQCGDTSTSTRRTTDSKPSKAARVSVSPVKANSIAGKLKLKEAQEKLRAEQERRMQEAIEKIKLSKKK